MLHLFFFSESDRNVFVSTSYYMNLLTLYFPSGREWKRTDICEGAWEPTFKINQSFYQGGYVIYLRVAGIRLCDDLIRANDLFPPKLHYGQQQPSIIYDINVCPCQRRSKNLTYITVTALGGWMIRLVGSCGLQIILPLRTWIVPSWGCISSGCMFRGVPIVFL